MMATMAFGWTSACRGSGVEPPPQNVTPTRSPTPGPGFPPPAPQPAVTQFRHMPEIRQLTGYNNDIDCTVWAARAARDHRS